MYNISVFKELVMKKNKQIINTIKAARGIEREEYFKNGGSLVSWRGGTRTVQRNKKTYSRKGKSKWKQ